MLFFTFMFFLLVVLPLVLGSMAILTEHRRKMAKLRLQANGLDRTEALERRVAELTALVHEQTIAIDSLGGRERTEPDRIEQRVGR